MPLLDLSLGAIPRYPGEEPILRQVGTIESRVWTLYGKVSLY